MTVIVLASLLIRVFEGLRLNAYQDSGGLWTIGFGHTRSVEPGQTITEPEAQAFLSEDAAPLLELVKDRPLIEAAALLSFGYNCGSGALGRVLSGEANLIDFNHAAGKILPGLDARRKLEAGLISVSKTITGEP